MFTQQSFDKKRMLTFQINSDVLIPGLDTNVLNHVAVLCIQFWAKYRFIFLSFIFLVLVLL
jgi:hypothetical protein